MRVCQFRHIRILAISSSDFFIIQYSAENASVFLIIFNIFLNIGQDVSRVLYLAIIYLDLLLPASSSHLPSGQRRAAAFYAHFGVAPDGVYTRNMLPYLPVSSYLTISTLPRHYPFRRNVSVALSLQLPAPDVIRHPRPVEPGLSSCIPKMHAIACLAQ